MMHPLVEEMVNDMSNLEKEQLKAMDQIKFGLWNKAVT